MSLYGQAYPGQLTGGVEADVMDANELATQAFLQESHYILFLSELISTYSKISMFP